MAVVEVGGIAGREALSGLLSVIGRVESSWRPASAEESFEIVRWRLFQPIEGQDNFIKRDKRPGPIVASTGTTGRNSRPSAGRQPTRNASSLLTPSNLRFLRDFTPTGPRCKTSSAPERAAPHGCGNPQPLGQRQPQPLDNAI